MTDYVKQLEDKKSQTKKHIDKNSDFQAFSKHHIGLLYASLVCPNLVCEHAFADLSLCSAYQSVLICLLTMTAASCFVTVCNCFQAQSFDLYFSRFRRILTVVWLKESSVCALFFHHVCTRKNNPQCNLRAHGRCFCQNMWVTCTKMSLITEHVGHQLQNQWHLNEDWPTHTDCDKHSWCTEHCSLYITMCIREAQMK